MTHQIDLDLVTCVTGNVANEKVVVIYTSALSSTLSHDYVYNQLLS